MMGFGFLRSFTALDRDSHRGLFPVTIVNKLFEIHISEMYILTSRKKIF